MESIFPALFVEPVAMTWAMPANHYDAARQMSVEDATGMPAFERRGPAMSCGSSCSSTTTSDSQMGINRGQDDSTTYTDTD